MKQGKSPGPDEISTEMLLALEGVGVDLLFDLITKIYETGTFPADMLKSVFVALPKIPRTLDCTNHSTISLMSHSLKFLLKIILQRIRRKLLPEISEAQYAFMKDRGTRNAIFNIRMLSERSIKHQQDIYLVFIDYKKAFDKVRHKELFNLLQAIQVDDKDLRILRSLSLSFFLRAYFPFQFRCSRVAMPLLDSYFHGFKHLSFVLKKHNMIQNLVVSA